MEYKHRILYSPSTCLLYNQQVLYTLSIPVTLPFHICFTCCVFFTECVYLRVSCRDRRPFFPVHFRSWYSVYDNFIHLFLVFSLALCIIRMIGHKGMCLYFCGILSEAIVIFDMCFFCFLFVAPSYGNKAYVNVDLSFPTIVDDYTKMLPGITTRDKSSSSRPVTSTSKPSSGFTLIHSRQVSSRARVPPKASLTAPRATPPSRILPDCCVLFEEDVDCYTSTTVPGHCDQRGSVSGHGSTITSFPSSGFHASFTPREIPPRVVEQSSLSSSHVLSQNATHHASSGLVSGNGTQKGSV